MSVSTIKLYSQNNNNTIPTLIKSSYVNTAPEEYTREAKYVLENARINDENQGDMLKRLPDPYVAVYRPPDEDLIMLEWRKFQDWLLEQDFILEPEWLEREEWYGGSRKKHKKEKRRKPTKRRPIKKMRKKRTIKRRR
tara:strand:- start:30 stop:443 length:414 start_codon:yes stop_codon:yes gene_type:complete